MTTGVGSLLRDWRSRRRFSQLDLALTAGVSARHLSFVETGRSQASRELLLALAEALDVPLRERNTLLLAAGYAPTYPASDLDSDALREVRAALEHLLAGHEPFPALVVDRYGDVQLANRAVAVLLANDAAALYPEESPERVSNGEISEVDIPDEGTSSADGPSVEISNAEVLPVESSFVEVSGVEISNVEFSNVEFSAVESAHSGTCDGEIRDREVPGVESRNVEIYKADSRRGEVDGVETTNIERGLPEIAAELLRPPINIYRLSLHPHGLAPRIRNLPDWSTHLIDQLTRQAHVTGDPRLADLLAEVRDYPAARHAGNDHPPGQGVLLALHLDHPAGRLHLHSTITHFGAPHDVTLAELAVESFFPADDNTRRILSRALTPP